MPVTEITYKTNKNLGNMEHESVEITYQLKPRESVDEAFDMLQEKALELLDINVKKANSANTQSNKKRNK